VSAIRRSISTTLAARLVTVFAVDFRDREGARSRNPENILFNALGDVVVRRERGAPDIA
jgi:hypothetical protein